jgi:hypothetical protein
MLSRFMGLVCRSIQDSERENADSELPFITLTTECKCKVIEFG